jgi:hypothetical protein
VSPIKRHLSRERKYFVLAKWKCPHGTAEDTYGTEAVTEGASYEEDEGRLKNPREEVGSGIEVPQPQ